MSAHRCGFRRSRATDAPKRGAPATSGATQALLGDASSGKNLDPAALQAWHPAGSEFGVGAGMLLMLLGVLMAAVTTGAFPVWLAATGLVLGVTQLTAFGFFASLAARRPTP